MEVNRGSHRGRPGLVPDDHASMGLRAILAWYPWAQQGRRDERGGRAAAVATRELHAWYRVNWLACSMKAWPTIGPSTEPVRIHIADSTKLYGLFP